MQHTSGHTFWRKHQKTMQLHHAAAIMDAACLTQRSQKYGLDEALFNINLCTPDSNPFLLIWIKSLVLGRVRQKHYLPWTDRNPHGDKSNTPYVPTVSNVTSCISQWHKRTRGVLFDPCNYCSKPSEWDAGPPHCRLQAIRHQRTHWRKYLIWWNQFVFHTMHTSCTNYSWHHGCNLDFP